MKFKIYNYAYIFIIVIVLLFFFITTTQKLEGFTPSIREMYRPYIRKARISGDSFYTHHSTNISNFLRKYAII